MAWQRGFPKFWLECDSLGAVNFGSQRTALIVSLPPDCHGHPMSDQTEVGDTSIM